jgi:hypothetical protein
MKCSFAVSLFALFVTACYGAAGPSDSSTADTGGSDSAAPDSNRPDTGMGWDAGDTTVETLSLTAGPYATPSGTERTQCVSFDLGNDSPVMIRAIRTHLTAGSHHMIVYRLDEAPDPTPVSCGAFAHGTAASLFIAQQPEASLVYPDDAGLLIEAHQTIGIEMHYINYLAGGSIDISGTVDLDVIAPDPSYGTVELLFTGDLDVSIPARGTATETSIHFVAPTSQVFGLTSHTHQLGVRTTIHRGRSTTDLGDLLHTSTNWSEPPLDTFDPLLRFDSGEGLVLTCEYDNPTDLGVGFGTGFDDEMCFLWAYLIR